MPKAYMDIADKKSPLKNPFKAFDHREFLCGWGSAFVNITMTYPLYKTIFRQVWRFSTLFWFFFMNFKLFSDASWGEDRNSFQPTQKRRGRLPLSRYVSTTSTENAVTVPDVRSLRWNQATRHRLLSHESIFCEMSCGDGRGNLWGCSDAIWTCSDCPSRQSLSPALHEYSSRF